MSTTPVSGQQVQPASGWYPKLEGMGLPRALTNGMQQSYSLIYSLRDTVNQLQIVLAKLIQYGTSQDRGNTNAQALPDGALWVESDTGRIYQARLASSGAREWTAVT